MSRADDSGSRPPHPQARQVESPPPADAEDSDQRFARLLRYSPYPNIPLKRVPRPDDHIHRPSPIHHSAAALQPRTPALPGYIDLLTHLQIETPSPAATAQQRPEPRERRHDRTRKDKLTKYVDAVVARRKELPEDNPRVATDSERSQMHLMHFGLRERSRSMSEGQAATPPERDHINRPTVWLAQRDRRRSCREQLIFRVRDAPTSPKFYEGVTYNELMRYGPEGLEHGAVALSPSPTLISVRLPCRYRPSSDGHEELNIALGCACPEKSELYDLAMTVMHNYMEMLTRLEHAQRLSQSIADVLPHLRLFSLYTYHDGKEWYPEIGFVNMRS